MNFTFNSQMEYHDWRRTKLHLSTPFQSKEDCFLDLETEEFFVVSSDKICSSASIDTLPLSFGSISDTVGVLVGRGDINNFMHYTPASNGYPEAPWDMQKFEKIYISTIPKVDPFFLCTFRGVHDMHPQFLDFDIEKVRQDADESYYRIKLTFNEQQALFNHLMGLE